MDPLTSPRHIKARQEVFKKFHHILRLRGPLEQAHLDELGVSTSQLDLDDAENFPQYFLPATPEKLASLQDRRPEMDPKITTDNWYQDCSITDRASLISATLIGQALNDDSAEADGPCLLDSTRWQDGGKMGKFERAMWKGENPSAQKRWSLQCRFEPRDHSYPHMAGFVNHGILEGAPLVRADILCAMAIMIDRMGFEWSQNHLIFPVLLMSFSGGQGRIIQTYFDGEIFHFRYSQFYNFVGMDKATVDLFLRWMMNDPVGDTAIVAALDSSTPGSSGRSPSKPHLLRAEATVIG